MIIAVANQKGGVGKTTTAVNLATAMAAAGYRVLLVDCDPQGNASTGLGIDRKQRDTSIYDLLLGQGEPADSIITTQIPGLSLIPSTAALSGAEVELVDQQRRSHRLSDALASLTQYDHILIDCAPSLGLLTLNALVAADAVLVPLQAEFFALEGLSQLLGTIERVRTSLNPQLKLLGIVLTMVDRRNRLSEQVSADVRAVMDEIGKAMMGTGEADGENRAIQAAEKAIANPLLDEISLEGARGVLINITGGYDLTLFELDEAANKIR